MVLPLSTGTRDLGPGDKLSHLRTSGLSGIPVLGFWLFGAFCGGVISLLFQPKAGELSVATWNLGRMGEHRSLTEIDAETLACVESAITNRNADIWVF